MNQVCWSRRTHQALQHAPWRSIPPDYFTPEPCLMQTLRPFNCLHMELRKLFAPPGAKNKQPNGRFLLPDVLIIGFISQSAIKKTGWDLITVRAVWPPNGHKNKMNDWAYWLKHEAVLIASCASEYLENSPTYTPFGPRAHCSAIKLMRSCCGSVRSELTSETTFRGGFGFECCWSLEIPTSARPHGLPLTKHTNLCDP